MRNCGCHKLHGGMVNRSRIRFGRRDALQVTVKVTCAARLAGTVKIQIPSAVSARSPPAPWRFRSTSYPLTLLSRRPHS